MTRLICLLICLTLFSCNRRLREASHTFGKLTVRVYSISEISNSYQYVDISKGGAFKTVFRSNDQSIDSIILRNDSLIIQTYPGVPLYRYEPKKLDVKIIIDSTIDPFRGFRIKKYF